MSNTNTFWDRRRIGTCLLFLLGAFVIDRALGAMLMLGFERVETGQQVGLANAAIANRDADIVIFGNSRARHHVMPSKLTEATGCTAYNAGVNGHGLYYFRMLESVMLSRGSDARLFVIALDPIGLMIPHRDRALAMTPFVDENPTVERIIRDVTRADEIKLLSWAYRFNGSALPILSNLARGGRSRGDGYISRGNKSLSATQSGLPTPRRHPSGLTLEEDVVRILRDFVSDANANGTEVVFVKGPSLNRWTDEQEAQRRLADLARELSVPLLLLDESAQPVFQDATLYRDLAHLNQRGAEMFSGMLAERLAEEGLRCEEPTPEAVPR